MPITFGDAKNVDPVENLEVSGTSTINGQLNVNGNIIMNPVSGFHLDLLSTTSVGGFRLSKNTNEQQGQFYISNFGEKDMVFDAASSITAMGVQFRTNGNPRLRLGQNGEIGINNSNGNVGDILTSNGTNAASWAAPGGGNSKVYGFSYMTNNSSATTVNNELLYFNRNGNTWTTDFQVGCTFTNGRLTFSRTGHFYVSVSTRINGRPVAGGTPYVILYTFRNGTTYKDFFWQGGANSNEGGADNLQDGTFSQSFIINITNTTDYLDFAAQMNTVPALIVGGVKSTNISVHNVD